MVLKYEEAKTLLKDMPFEVFVFIYNTKRGTNKTQEDFTITLRREEEKSFLNNLNK